MKGINMPLKKGAYKYGDEVFLTDRRNYGDISISAIDDCNPLYGTPYQCKGKIIYIYSSDTKPQLPSNSINIQTKHLNQNPTPSSFLTKHGRDR
jgi:hypothetical protein